MKSVLLDWNFWTVVIAFFALLISSLPYLKKVFLRGKLKIDMPSTFTIDHKTGKPIIFLYLTLRNIGGSDILIKSIELQVSSDEHSFKLKGNSYLQSNIHPSYTILNPFQLKTDDNWSYSVYFEERWSRNKNIEYRRLESNIRKHIQIELSRNPPTDAQPIEAKEEDVNSIRDFYLENYKWIEGKHDVKVVMSGDSSQILAEYDFEFYLYKAETEELETYSEEYKYGYGIYLNNPNKSSLVIDIQDKKSNK